MKKHSSGMVFHSFTSFFTHFNEWIFGDMIFITTFAASNETRQTSFVNKKSLHIIFYYKEPFCTASRCPGKRVYFFRNRHKSKKVSHLYFPLKRENVIFVSTKYKETMNKKGFISSSFLFYSVCASAHTEGSELWFVLCCVLSVAILNWFLPAAWCTDGWNRK